MRFFFYTFIFLIVCFCSIWLTVARTFDIPIHKKIHNSSPNINPKELEELVRKISQDFHPRDSEHPEKLHSLSQYIFDEFSKNSLQVEFQEYKIDNKNYRNVIAKFGPETENIIVIGAHYDSYSELPGADDNASGVAGLIELGKLLETLELTKQVQLVAYTLEEPPYFASEYMGSYIHASSLKEKGISVDLMISLEMIGYFNDQPNSQSYPAPLLDLIYPKSGNFIAVVDKIDSNNASEVKSAINKHSSVEAYSINAPSFLTVIDFSDHRNYWAFGFPAVMVTDTAFFRNEAYHTRFDTFDRLNYKKMAEVIHGVFKFIETTSTQT